MAMEIGFDEIKHAHPRSAKMFQHREINSEGVYVSCFNIEMLNVSNMFYLVPPEPYSMLHLL